MKELLIKLRDAIQKNGLDNLGLCYAITMMYGISGMDKERMIEYLYDHQPKTIRRLLGFDFWWRPGRVAPRIKWLNKQIKKTMKTVTLKTIPIGEKFRFKEGMNTWVVVERREEQYLYCESVEEHKTRSLNGTTAKHHKLLFDQTQVVAL